MGRKSLAERYRDRERAYEEQKAQREAAVRAVADARALRVAQRERKELRAKIRAETGAVHLCSICDGPHRTRKCPTKPYVPLTTGSRAERAALACRDENITLREAGERLGITHQAVSQAWIRMFPGVKPPRTIRKDVMAHEIVVEMAKAGRPLHEICEATGFGAPFIYQVARRADVSVHTVPGKRDAFEAAISAVAAGASLGEAAGEYGVSWGRLGDLCRERGVFSQAKGGRGYGNGRKAAETVRSEGITVAEAARRFRCSPMAVRAALDRIAEGKPARTRETT